MIDSVVPLERNLYGYPWAGLSWERQFEKILLKYGWEKIPNWECLFVHREKGLFLTVSVDDIKLAGKKQNLDPMWKVLNKEVDLGEPTSFLDHVYLGCTQRQCQTSKDTVDNYRTMFESRISAGEGGREITIPSKSSYFFMVLWHGWSCQEMCGTILWVGKQDDLKTLQSINSVHWWPSFQRRRIEIRGRIVKSMLSNCSEMLALGTYWKTWYSMVSEQTCTIDYKIDQGFWQTIESFGILFSPHMWIQTVLLCGKHSTTMQIRIVSGLRFCWRSWGFKIYIRRNIVSVFGSHTFVPISWMCKKQTSVSHRSTESEIISLDAGLRLDGIPAFDLWDLIVGVLGNTNQSNKEQGDPLMNKREVRSTPHTIQKRKQSQGVINDLDNVDFIPSKRQFFSSGSFVVCVWRQRSSDQDDYKGKKPDNETCFQNPQSCSWLVIR